MKTIYYTDRIPGDPSKGLSWIEIDEETAKRLRIQHLYLYLFRGGRCVVQDRQGEKYEVYLDNPHAFGGRYRRKFIVHTHGESIPLLAYHKLTINAVLYFVKTWADTQARVVTPGGRSVTLSGIGAELPAYVYFILNNDSNAVKIGIAKNVERRLKSLQTSSPAQLKLLGRIQVENLEAAKALEKSLHQKFSHLQLTGEWFRQEQELIHFYQNLGDRNQP